MVPLRTRLPAVAALLLLAGCGEPVPDPLGRSSSPATGPAATPPASRTSGSAREAGENCEYVPSGSPARPVQPPSASGVPTSGVVSYLLQTTEGKVRLTLDRVAAPCTVHSFEALADQGFFDRTRCHRLVDSTVFLLQCGDPTGTGSGGPGYTFADETDGTESYTAGVVAMANGGPHTNGSQFFLVYDDSTSLDAEPNYTIFGRMDEASRGVVARIAAEGQDGTDPAGGGKPNNPAEITAVTRAG